MNFQASDFGLMFMMFLNLIPYDTDKTNYKNQNQKNYKIRNWYYKTEENNLHTNLF